MRHKEHGDAALTVNAGNLHLQLTSGYLVHGAKGLVHEKDVRRGRKGARDANALLLASRKLGRITLEKVVRQVHDPLAHGLLGAALVALVEQVGNVRDVLLHRHVRKEDAPLDGIANVATQRDWIGVAHVRAVNQHVAGCGLDKAVHHLERGGLAATGGADDGEKLPAAHAQVEVRKHDLLAVGLRDVPVLNCNVCRFTHLSSPLSRRYSAATSSGSFPSSSTS